MSTAQKRSSAGCFRLFVSLFFSFLLFCCLLVATFAFIISIVVAVQAIRLPSNGIQTQAIVVNVESTTCGKYNTPGYDYIVRFTDQSGNVQNSSLTCESIPTLSPGDSISIVYSPNNPTLITLPDEAGYSPIGGVIVIIIFGLVELALLLCCIFWVRHERHILGPLLSGRKRARARQALVAGQVVFGDPIPDSYVKNENQTAEKEQPEASQLAFFGDQDAQEEKPFEQ